MRRRAVCGIGLGEVIARLVALARHLGYPRWRRNASLVMDSAPKRGQILHNASDGCSRVTSGFGTPCCHIVSCMRLSSIRVKDAVCLPVFHEVIFGCRPLIAWALASANLS